MRLLNAEKVQISMDLTDTSLRHIVNMMWEKGDRPVSLVYDEKYYNGSGLVTVDALGLGVSVFPHPDLSNGQWYLMGEKTVIWSPGA